VSGSPLQAHDVVSSKADDALTEAKISAEDDDLSVVEVPADDVVVLLDGAPVEDAVVRNADVDWDQWPVEQYIAEIYAELHPIDAAVIDHHSAYYRTLAPGSVARSLEFGAGPNLYPLMLAAGCSVRIDALEPSAASVAYLRRQLSAGPDDHWNAFYARCRSGNATLPASLDTALSRVRVLPGSGLDLALHGYDLASMHFVAESVTESAAEFAALCLAFIRSVRPGGHLIAAFMEKMPSYSLSQGPQWPGYPVDADQVRRVFADYTEELVIDRIDSDPSLPDYGDSGMIVLTARRSVRG
jgi:hypothetical protein